MDASVRAAMEKWPNVPDCYGWLALDQRGNWYLRDLAAQSAGAFNSAKPGAKGSLLEHRGLIEFIQRNYACDDKGQWYFQNGPQRVYVELQATPWIWRLSPTWQVSAHDGRSVQTHTCLIDQDGMIYLHTSLGFGLVHSMDTMLAADALQASSWTLEMVDKMHLPARFGYICSPESESGNL